MSKMISISQLKNNMSTKSQHDIRKFYNVLSYFITQEIDRSNPSPKVLDNLYKRQAMIYDLLVDGSKMAVSCQPSFINVKESYDFEDSMLLNA